MEQPTGTIPLEAVVPIANLFERAFTPSGVRPSPESGLGGAEWVSFKSKAMRSDTGTVILRVLPTCPCAS